MQLSTALFSSCRTHKPAKQLPTAGSQITRTIAGIAATGLVLSSAGFGAVFAWTSGAAHGPLLATLMVIMAVALELAKPLAVSAAFAAFRSLALGRALALSLLAIVSIGYSLTAEVQLIAGSRGDLVAKREAVIEGHSDRRESVKQARAELATLAPSRTIEEAKADVVKLLAANPKAGNCRDATGGATARSVCPRVAVLHGEVARAKRRAELLATINKVTEQPVTGAAVKSADPGASALATYLATLGVDISAARLGDLLVLVPVLALELGAALSLILVQAVGGAPASGHGMMPVVEQKADSRTQTRPARPDSTPPDTESRANASDPEPRPTEKRTPRKAKKRTPGKGDKGGSGGQSGKRRLGNVIDLLKARGGQISGGQRGIAKKLRLSKSRVNEMLHELAAAGMVDLSTTRQGTRVALVA